MKRFMAIDKQFVDTGAFIAVSDRSDQLEIITVNEDIEKRAWLIFKKYQDQPFSYTDCTSFAVMETHKLKTAFAFDAHFEIFGFKIAPPMT